MEFAIYIAEYQDDVISSLGMLISAGIVIWGIDTLGRALGWR